MKKRARQATTSRGLNYLDSNKETVNSEYAKKSIALSTYIDNFLEDENLKQKDIAEKLGIAESQLSKWLSGYHNLTLKSILKLESVCPIEILNPLIWTETSLVSRVIVRVSTTELTGELLCSPISVSSSLDGFGKSGVALADLLINSNITTAQKASKTTYAMAA